MATELTTPVTVETSSQEVSLIVMNILQKTLQYRVKDFDASGNELNEERYIVRFSDIPSGTAKDNLIAAYTTIVGYARSQGQLGDGTDTNPLT